MNQRHGGCRPSNAVPRSSAFLEIAMPDGVAGDARTSIRRVDVHTLMALIESRSGLRAPLFDDWLWSGSTYAFHV